MSTLIRRLEKALADITEAEIAVCAAALRSPIAGQYREVGPYTDEEKRYITLMRRCHTDAVSLQPEKAATDRAMAETKRQQYILFHLAQVLDGLLYASTAERFGPSSFLQVPCRGWLLYEDRTAALIMEPMIGVLIPTSPPVTNSGQDAVARDRQNSKNQKMH